MRANRSGKPDKTLADGPAKLCQAMGIAKEFDGVDICCREAKIFVEDSPAKNLEITAHQRIGLYSVPEPWKSIDWNFRIDPTKI